MSALRYKEQYFLAKSTYSTDPFNIPEKLYAYLKVNNITVDEYPGAQQFVDDNLVEVPYGKSYADLTKIPPGVDPKIRKELTGLLSAFCMDPDNGTVEMKKSILSDIGDEVVERMGEEPRNSSKRTVLNMSFLNVNKNSSSAAMPERKKGLGAHLLAELENNSNEEEAPVPQRSETEHKELHADFRKSLSATLRRQRENTTDWLTQLRLGEAKALKSLPVLQKKKGGNRKTRRVRNSRRQTRRIQNRRK